MNDKSNVSDIVIGAFEYIADRLHSLVNKQFTYDEFITHISSSIDTYLLKQKDFENYHGGYLYLKPDKKIFSSRIIMTIELYSKDGEQWNKNTAEQDITQLLDSAAVQKIIKEKEIKLPIEPPEMPASSDHIVSSNEKTAILNGKQSE